MTTPSDGLLFDISPEERDGQKKKPRKTRKSQESQPQAGPVEFENGSRFLASVESECPQCGCGLVDLVAIRKLEGKIRWIVQCGWSCLLSWPIEPIAGVLDSEPDREEFRVRGVRPDFDGKTFAEIVAAGGRWYVEQLAASSKRARLAEAAASYLKSH